MGDSITELWRLAESFPGQPFVNRGISGQTSSQMLARMFQDVIALKPAAVVILAGTNDISRATGAVTAQMVEDNIQAMAQLATANGIKVCCARSCRPMTSRCQQPARRLARARSRRPAFGRSHARKNSECGHRPTSSS